MCCSQVCVKKKIKKESILYNCQTWKRCFVHETRPKPPEIRDNTWCLCHAHSRTNGLEVTVIYTGQNLKLNAFRLGTKNTSLGNRLDNGQQKKLYSFLPLFGMAFGLQFTCGSEYRCAIRRVSIIQPF